MVPHVQVLATFPEVDKIFLCTIERNDFERFSPSSEKVEHIPLVSSNYDNVIFNKINDFVKFSRKIKSIVGNEKIDLLICRSSLAGGIGYLVSKATRVPYVVESFEPHASYMADAGIWKRYDPRYWIERFFQRLQCHTASFILPVSNNYLSFLEKKGINRNNVIVLPCVVDLIKFARRDNPQLKASLNIPIGATIGIYVGKFGGIYYDEEAFWIFRLAKEVFENFFLLILTPSDQNEVQFKLKGMGFELSEFKVLHTPHSEVPHYLSISDFAFALYKHSYSNRYLSPVKIGEYWACGLPVLLTDGVGDDSDIINASNCGATFFLQKRNIMESLAIIKNQLFERDIRERGRKLAERYRNPIKLLEAYRKILSRSY